MTPYELYQFYLNKYRNPEGSSLVKQEVQPTYTLPEVLPVSETGGDETTTGPTSTGKGIGSISMSDIGKAIGFAMNPVLGIASMGFQAVTGKTPMQAVQDTLSSMGIGTAATGPTAPGAGMGFGGGYATDVGFGGMGTSPGPSGVDPGVGPGGCATGTSGPSTDPGVGPGGCDTGGGDGGNGGSGAGGADAGTGPGGCGYATGGRVGYANGSSDKIDYWITVQEMYDDAGGEAGTGLGLIDFANKYFPKMEDGGRPGYLQGGLVSLLR